MEDLYKKARKDILEVSSEISQCQRRMADMFRNNNLSAFRQTKARLIWLEEEKNRVMSNGQEQRFAMRHSPENIHQFIDLIGFTKEEAVEIT